MWFFGNLFSFWRTFLFKKKKWIYLNTSILWCGFFFVCIHELKMMYIESTHHCLGKGLLCFRRYVLVTFVSRICESLLRVTWVHSLIFILTLRLIPQLASWLVSPARPLIWCKFNIGLILVVQIKSSWHFMDLESILKHCFTGYRPMKFHTHQLWTSLTPTGQDNGSAIVTVVQ